MPIGQSRRGGTQRAHNADSDRRIRTALVLSPRAHGVKRIHDYCGRPRADRNVRENHVERVSKPSTVKEVFDLLSTGNLECFAREVVKTFLNGVKPFLVGNEPIHTVISHRAPRTTWVAGL